MLPAKFGLMDLLQLMRKAKELMTIDMTEEGLREWLRSLVKLGEFLTAITGTKWDDDVLAILDRIVESDEVYGAVYAVINRIISDEDAGPIDEDLPMVAARVQSVINAEPGVQTVLTGAEAGDADKPDFAIPWITVIGLVIKIILMIRERRQNQE